VPRCIAFSVIRRKADCQRQTAGSRPAAAEVAPAGHRLQYPNRLPATRRKAARGGDIDEAMIALQPVPQHRNAH
jgi:hypothetical protein